LPKKPDDIPAAPYGIYGKEFKEKGGMGTWLGTGFIASYNRKYLPYDEVLHFVRALNLKSSSEWKAYCRGERLDLPMKPDNIPASINRVYGKEFADKGGMGAWLGQVMSQLSS
jgi:hypothetical protein